jgi:hypothetical protein
MANRHGDKAVAAMSAVIEALAHLQHGTSSDAIEQAQRAVAVARSHQLNDELRHIPQLSTLVQMVDICCSLLEYDVNQSSLKLKVMQDLMDERLSDPNWRADGSFSIPLSGRSAGPSSIDTGDILQVQNGTLLLSFNWLPQHDLYALCYFLSSITLSSKNSYDGRKAEKFLQEGIRMVKGMFYLVLGFHRLLMGPQEASRHRKKLPSQWSVRTDALIGDEFCIAIYFCIRLFLPVVVQIGIWRIRH